MAEAKQCDRCGRYFKCDDNYLELKVRQIIERTTHMFWDEYDLCDSCQKDFDNFINPYKEEG